MLNAIDQSWGYCPPSVVRDRNIELVMMYLSYTPSKNISVAKVKAYWEVQAASGLNWESHPGAPLLGAARGRSDAIAAVRQAKALIKALGYTIDELTEIYRRNGWLGPHGRIGIIFSCDTDANPGKTLAYYRAATAVCEAAGLECGAYGSYRLIKYLLRKKAITIGWQTYAWSYGAVLKAAHLLQYSNSHTLGGAAVDYDHIQSRKGLGALWPPHMVRPGFDVTTPAPEPKKRRQRKPSRHHRARVYTVKRGDTLSKIAGAHGTTWQKLARLNHLHHPNLIHVGQKIKLTAGKAPKAHKPRHLTYKVRRGDTLSGIAQAHHIKGGWRKLQRINHLHNPNLIRVGQTIRLG